MRTVVLDASAGVEIALRTFAGRRLRHELGAAIEAWAPEHFFVEVAGVLRRAVARGDLSSDRAGRALSRLMVLALQRVPVKPLIEEAWALGDNVTIADGVYVVLARSLGAEFATLDERLARAPNLGVAIVTVPPEATQP